MHDIHVRFSDCLGTNNVVDLRNIGCTTVQLRLLLLPSASISLLLTCILSKFCSSRAFSIEDDVIGCGT